MRDEVAVAHREDPQHRADLPAAERRGRHLLAVATHLEAPEQLQPDAGHCGIVLAPRVRHQPPSGCKVVTGP
ncbi:hypothetical protein [Pseudonocardia sp. SCN 73-27]|uniref:hypothetical protein n=1 Tax=Pseudonocardia sp. SCN 73-27 TaxID=1660132 RepID=UPI0025E13F0E|nr:hypothetical protein [Pseudonocardia sp. SCN 73-27]